MKRAFLRKVKSVSCSSCESHASVGESEQTVSGVRRKARTSAAMVGLALSMGATSLLVPRQNDGAAAAESKTPEVTPSSVSRVATLPSEPNVELPTSSSFSESEVTNHTVRDGQTLQQIADRYQVTLGSLAAANGLTPTASLRAGQVLRIPVGSEAAKVEAAQSPQLLALADVNRLPAPSDASRSNEQLRVERTQAFNRLRRERIKLKENLAELRREESRSAVGEVTDATAGVTETNAQKLVEKPAVQANSAQTIAELPRSSTNSTSTFPSIATLPSPVASSVTPSVTVSPMPELDWMRTSQSLVLPGNESKLVPQQPEQVEIPTADSLISSNQVAVRPEALAPSPAPLTPVPLVDALPQETSYQVSPGDTIARIARAHNITQASLIAANRLSNPNVIFVGQVLRLPGNAADDTSVEPNSLPSVLPVAVASASRDLSDVPIVPTQVDSPSPMAVIPSSLSPEVDSVQPANLEVEPNLPSTIGGRNPYVQNLLSEVRSLRERRLQQRTGSPEPTPIAAASPVGAEVLRGQSALESRSVERLRTPEVVQAAPQQASPTVVAAAPLGSERYEPLLQPITGRMVSPDLPALPDAERFLPSGSFQGMIWPARGVLSSGYGWRWGRMHHGIDIAADIGTPIYAAAGGVVEYAGWNSGGYGNMIEIRHADGSMTRYAHLNAIYVQSGQRVGQSEQIGEMGSTGYSTGPHLHFEVHLADQGTVNPISYLPAE